MPVGNLREVVAAIDGATTPFLRLDMDYDQVGDMHSVAWEDMHSVAWKWMNVMLRSRLCTASCAALLMHWLKLSWVASLQLCTDGSGCCPSVGLCCSYCPHQMLQFPVNALQNIFPPTVQTVAWCIGRHPGDSSWA
jgi:hypothetical protein